jgi:Skp family chaperone for outer membrane proteins
MLSLAICVLLSALCSAAGAQQAVKVSRIGYLGYRERYHESTCPRRVEKTYLSIYFKCSSDPDGISSNLVVFC